MSRSKKTKDSSVHPVVFAFSARTQFGQVAGDHDGWDRRDRSEVHHLAKRLAEAVQKTPFLTGVAVRSSRAEIGLVAIPVATREAGSDRIGLPVVVGVATSRSSSLGVPLLAQAFHALAAAVVGLFPDGDLHTAVDALTGVLQGDNSTPLLDDLRVTVDAVAGCFTFLAKGYQNTTGQQPSGVSLSDAPAAVLHRMLITQLRGSGHDQFGQLLPIAAFATQSGQSMSSAPIGPITNCYFMDDTVYICQSARLPVN